MAELVQEIISLISNLIKKDNVNFLKWFSRVIV
jgi:hypothetical protein